MNPVTIVYDPAASYAGHIGCYVACLGNNRAVKANGLSPAESLARLISAVAAMGGSGDPADYTLVN